MQQFGIGFDRLHLPAQWSSTPNALERVAFDFKDVVAVVDDFAPTGSTHDIARYHATADRVLRGAGNAAGRGRMAADGSARPDLPPRGLIVGTGEDVPKGHSARARAVVVEVAPGEVDLSRLTACQAAARDGAYAAATAGYVRWLAGRLDALGDALPGMLADLRRAAGRSGAHARTPEAVANLALGWRLWLDFARDGDALTAPEAAAAWDRAWGALMALGAEQPVHQGGEAPARRFLDLLTAAIESGQAHVAGPDGDDGFERQEWRARGALVGWLDGDDLYFQLDAAYAAAQRVGQASGSGIAVQPTTLAKRLNEAGLLRSAERDRGKLTVRKSFAGQRRPYLHLPASALSPEEPAHPAHPAHPTPETAPLRGDTAPNGPVSWADSGGRGPEQAQHVAPESAQLRAAGPIGPVGPVFPEGGTGAASDKARCLSCDGPLPPDRRYNCRRCEPGVAA